MGTYNKNAVYRGNWGVNDIIGAASVLLIKDEWKEIGKITVPADQLIGLGFGDAVNQDAASGRLFVDLQAAGPADIVGQFRIMITSSNDLPLGGRPVLIDYDLATTRIGASNRSERLPNPYNGIMLSKDKVYKFLVKNTAAAAQTVTRADSSVEIDISKQMV